MLYLFHGSNFQITQEKGAKLIASLRVKRPDAEFFVFEAEDLTEADLEQLAGGQGLFDQKYIVLLKDVLADERTQELFVEKKDFLKASDNIFVVREHEVSKVVLKKVLSVFERVVESGEKHNAAAVWGEGRSSLFALADLYQKKDRRALWLAFHRERLAGTSAEEIHGILLWSVRSMLAAAQSENATDAGLKPFVFGKAKSASKRFSHDELVSASRSLIESFHESRVGGVSLEIGMERFLLG